MTDEDEDVHHLQHRDVTTVVTPRPSGGGARTSRATWPVLWLRHALRLCAALTAVATLALASVAGLGFLWCAPMAEARLHCCCPPDEVEEGDVVERLCCERRETADMPSGRLANAPELIAHPAAPLPVVVTFDPRPNVTASIPRRPARRPMSRARGSPATRVHAACSVYLL